MNILAIILIVYLSGVVVSFILWWKTFQYGLKIELRNLNKYPRLYSDETRGKILRNHICKFIFICLLSWIIVIWFLAIN